MDERFRSDVLTVEIDGPIATLWLDRPQAKNALGPAFWADLPEAMAGLSADDSVRAVVLAARGSDFSVGLDLKAMGDLLAGGTPTSTDQAPASPAIRAQSMRATISTMQRAISAVAACVQPVIAAVHGHCLGGGVDLAAACDVRMASADAVFSVRETKVAIVADLGSLQRLPKIIGAGHVAELALTGKDIGAQRALEIGLVNSVHPDHEALLDAARALAAEIAANSPIAVQGTKAILSANDGRTVAEGLDYVATWNAGMLLSDDLTEAMTAFVEKRPPGFTGR